MCNVYGVWVINRVMIVIIMRWCAGDRSQEVRHTGRGLNVGTQLLPRLMCIPIISIITDHSRVHIIRNNFHNFHFTADTGSCAELHRPGPGGMWHVIMWWHLSCSVSATHHWWPVWWCLSPATDLWPVHCQCHIMTSAWQRKSINNPLLWQQCHDSDEAETVLMVSDVMGFLSASWLHITALSVLISWPWLTILGADIDPGRNIYQLTSDNVLVTQSA